MDCNQKLLQKHSFIILTTPSFFSKGCNMGCVMISCFYCGCNDFISHWNNVTRQHHNDGESNQASDSSPRCCYTAMGEMVLIHIGPSCA